MKTTLLSLVLLSATLNSCRPSFAQNEQQQPKKYPVYMTLQEAQFITNIMSTSDASAKDVTAMNNLIWVQLEAATKREQDSLAKVKQDTIKRKPPSQ